MQTEIQCVWNNMLKLQKPKTKYLKDRGNVNTNRGLKVLYIYVYICYVSCKIVKLNTYAKEQTGIIFCPEINSNNKQKATRSVKTSL